MNLEAYLPTGFTLEDLIIVMSALSAGVTLLAV